MDSSPQQARLGSDCPFSVIGISAEREVHSRAVSDTGSLAAQLADGSAAWRSRLAAVHASYREDFASGELPHTDLTSAASHHILLECLDETSEGGPLFDIAPLERLRGMLRSCLTGRLPAITISSHHIDEGVPALADLVLRGVPLLLLDCRERAFMMQQAPSQPRTSMARLSDAFPSAAAEVIEKAEVDDGKLALGGRGALLDAACEMIERQWQQLVKNATVDMRNASDIALLHSALHVGLLDGVTSASAQIPLHARIDELERVQRDSMQVCTRVHTHACTHAYTRADR